MHQFHFVMVLVKRTTRLSLHNGGMNTSAASSTPVADPFGLRFDNSFARDLVGCYVPWQAQKVPQARLVQLNTDLARSMGLDVEGLASPEGVALLSGHEAPAGAQPVAQVYAGHQFGGFSAQLGDGRALLLGEVINPEGQRRDLALKGSGPTPFSRGGDGKAALGPVLREYLMGEAMHALGIPTTRALAAVATGTYIMREDALPGAVLTRVAASHLRVGTFQFFASRRELEKLNRLAHYTLARHYPEYRPAPHVHQDLDAPLDPLLALELFKGVCQRQAQLVAQWMAVGFIHGVMNTDNMTLSGETIDYGPCAMMDAYSPGTVYSSIDRQGRYAFGNQPAVARWNLARFAECLLPLMSDGSEADNAKAVQWVSDVLDGWMDAYESFWLQAMRRKMGLSDLGATGIEAIDLAANDLALAKDLLVTLVGQNADYTGVMRALASAASNPFAPTVIALFDDTTAYRNWAPRWQRRLGLEPQGTAFELNMNRANPLYIARNHKVEEALSAAVQHNDLQPFQDLLALLQQPFTERVGKEDYARPAPLAVQQGYRTFCGT